MDTSKKDVNTKIATVLVVEDCGMNQMLLEIMLHRLNHKVLFAYDGQEAMKVLQDTPVDLVLSDIMMPQMDGFELLDNIHAKMGRNHVPVVLMSAGGKVSLSNEAINRGADGFLSHPFSSIELQQMLNQFTNSH